MTPFPDDALAAADAVLRAGVADGLWPGLVGAVGTGATGATGAGVQREWVLGRADTTPGAERPMTADTVFDLASLTKILATAPAVLLLVRDGALRLDDTAARWLPPLDPRVTVAQLLTHSSGLPAHVDLAPGAGPGESSPAALVAAAASTPLAAAPGTVVAYSDLGYVLLGALVEAISGQRLDETVAARVLGPLGSGARFLPPASWLGRTAATEVVDGTAVVGRVHDENAAAARGPVGHAGLFGTAADVRACLAPWCPGGPLLDDELRAEALRDHTAGLPDAAAAEPAAPPPPPHMSGVDGHRGLGWTCRGDRYDILSPGWGDAAVSHTGFTGTSVALDPRSGRWAVLLTNAVHLGRGRPAVFAARRAFHAVLAGDPPVPG